MGEDLRQRYAEALAAAFGPSGECRSSNPLRCECGPHAGASARFDRLADAAMAVRDEELERLRTIGDEYRRVVRRLNREFDRIAHVRRVLDSYGLLDESHYGSKDLLAAFDSQETDHG